MLVNVEKWHHVWLEEMSKFSWDYLSKKHGPTASNAVILTLEPDCAVEDDCSDCDIVRSRRAFELPPRAGTLIMHMARFAKSSLSQPYKIEGANFQELPENTFCLKSLLQASFPKDLDTGFFKHYDGSTTIGNAPEGLYRAPHVAFSGIGIILMQNARMAFDPMLPDEDVIFEADGSFLVVND